MCEIDWLVVLEFVRVLLNWPFLAFAVASVLLVGFWSKLGGLIDRVSRVGPVAIGPHQSEAVEPADLPVPEGAVPTEEVRALADRAVFFEFRYLNYFLAPATQQVLDWLCSYGPLSRAGLDVLDIVQAFPAYERDAIVEALNSHQLIVDSPHLEATVKGRAYQQWTGRRVLSVPPVSGGAAPTTA